MKKPYYLVGLAALALVGCSDNDFLSDGPGGIFGSSGNGELSFGIGNDKTTRAGEITGEEAAKKLGNQFLVYGWKEANTNSDVTDKTLNDVFQDYKVVWKGTASAGTSETNTRGWEYVGEKSVPSPLQSGQNMGAIYDQVIHYWDYSTHRYDFIAWNVLEDSKAQLMRRNKVAGAAVTKLADPELEFFAPTAKDLSGIYVSDKFTSVPQWATPTDFAADKHPATGIWEGDFAGLENINGSVDAAGKELHPNKQYHRGVYNQTGKQGIPNSAAADNSDVVNLMFRNLAAKVRIGIYETIPGYEVSDIVFYAEESPTVHTVGSSSAPYTYDVTKVGNKNYSLLWNVTDANHNYDSDQSWATLFGADFTRRGNLVVKYHDSKYNAYDPADPNIAEEKDNVAYSTISDAQTAPFYSFGQLTNERGSETWIEHDPIGTTSATASMSIGNDDNKLYTYVFPMETNTNALELKVNYLLTSIDGSKENIRVTGANATVPVEFSKWKSNYAYTYLFKISDNTNGNTGGNGIDPAGLYPITFNACVVNDADGIQETITTVNDKSITTYQNGSKVTANNEYKKGDNNTGTYTDQIFFTVEGTSANALLELNNTPGASQNVWLYTAWAADPSIITEEAVANYMANNIVLTDVTDKLDMAQTEAPNQSGAQYSIKFAANTVACFEPMCKYYVVKAKSGSDITYKVIKIEDGSADNTYAITLAASSIENDGSTTFTIANSATNTDGKVTGADGALRVFNSASKDVTDLFDITQTEDAGVYTYTIKSNAPADTYTIKLGGGLATATLTVETPVWDGTDLISGTIKIEENTSKDVTLKAKSGGSALSIIPNVTPAAGAKGTLNITESAGTYTITPSKGAVGTFTVEYNGASFTVQVDNYSLAVSPTVINMGDEDIYKTSVLTLTNANSSGTSVDGTTVGVTSGTDNVSLASTTISSGKVNVSALAAGTSTLKANNATVDIEVVNISLTEGSVVDGVKTILLKKDDVALNGATFTTTNSAKVQATTKPGVYKVTGTGNTTITYFYKGVEIAKVLITF